VPSELKKKKVSLGLSKKYKKLKKAIGKKLSPNKVKLLVFLAVLVILYLLRSSFIVAIVNNVPITRFSFNKKLEEAVGKDTLENLIAEKLIFQELKKQGVVVSDVEIQKEISDITALIEQQGSTLEDALALQGMTIQDLEENIGIQKAIEKILEDKIQVTDEEVQEYFATNAELFGEDAVFEDVKEDIKQQLTNQELNTEYGKWLEKIKAESSIIYFVNF
jgi:foldase protein PrsA